MIVTVALADPLTVFGGTLRSSWRDRLEAATGSQNDYSCCLHVVYKESQ